jgi:hypothetical protein
MTKSSKIYPVDQFRQPPVPDVLPWCYNLHTPILYIRLWYLLAPAECIRLLISASLNNMWQFATACLYCTNRISHVATVCLYHSYLSRCYSLPVLYQSYLPRCYSVLFLVANVLLLTSSVFVYSQVTVCRKIVIWELHSVLLSCNSRWTHLHLISFQMYLNRSKIHLLGSCSTIRFQQRPTSRQVSFKLFITARY